MHSKTNELPKEDHELRTDAWNNSLAVKMRPKRGRKALRESENIKPPQADKRSTRLREKKKNGGAELKKKLDQNKTANFSATSDVSRSPCSVEIKKLVEEDTSQLVVDSENEKEASKESILFRELPLSPCRVVITKTKALNTRETRNTKLSSKDGGVSRCYVALSNSDASRDKLKTDSGRLCGKKYSIEELENLIDEEFVTSGCEVESSAFEKEHMSTAISKSSRGDIHEPIANRSRRALRRNSSKSRDSSSLSSWLQSTRSSPNMIKIPISHTSQKNKDITGKRTAAERSNSQQSHDQIPQGMLLEVDNSATSVTSPEPRKIANRGISNRVIDVKSFPGDTVSSILLDDHHQKSLSNRKDLQTPAEVRCISRLKSTAQISTPCVDASNSEEEDLFGFENLLKFEESPLQHLERFSPITDPQERRKSSRQRKKPSNVDAKPWLALLDSTLSGAYKKKPQKRGKSKSKVSEEEVINLSDVHLFEDKDVVIQEEDEYWDVQEESPTKPKRNKPTRKRAIKTTTDNYLPWKEIMEHELVIESV